MRIKCTITTILFMFVSPLVIAGGGPASDRGLLIEFYMATEGENWTDSTGWKAAPLSKDGFNDNPCTEPLWFGIECDENQRVIGIDLIRNNLAGALPESIGQLTELVDLSLSVNDLGGSIPETIGNLTKLRRLALNNNQTLSGDIPESIGNLTELEELFLQSNDLTGNIPPLGNLTSLRRLNLSNNPLTGTIPEDIGELSMLESLELISNRLTGSIPEGIGNLESLRTLFLLDNQLTGPLPDGLGSLPSLSRLDLRENRLSGPLPAELGENDGVSILLLGDNLFNGSIPSSWGGMTRLRTLDLSDNQLSGPIPPELGQLTEVNTFDLSNNLLSGAIPPELGNLEGTAFFFLQNNLLGGPIPPELGNLAAVRDLYLSSNHLTGEIPAELALPAELSELDLSSNHLEGSVPDELVERLREGNTPPDRAGNPGLDVRFNNLFGTEGNEIDAAQRGDGPFQPLQNLVAAYPQVPLGGGLQGVLLVSNSSSVPWSGEAHLDAGLWPQDVPWELNGESRTGQTSFVIELNPRETRQFIISSTAEQPVSGWLVVQADENSQPAEAATSLFFQAPGGEFRTSLGAAAATPGRLFEFPVEMKPGTDIGVALRGLASSVSLTLFGPDGSFLNQRFLRGDQAMLLTEIFLELPESFVGFARATSFETQFFVAAIRVEVNDQGISLSNLDPSRRR